MKNNKDKGMINTKIRVLVALQVGELQLEQDTQRNTKGF
jgi:hypothetical protein